MKKCEIISELQSRIAKRRKVINIYWDVYRAGTILRESSEAAVSIAQELGETQRFDKALLRQLHSDERDIRILKRVAAELMMNAW